MANLREEYKQHIHNTAPDMDKLWNRISDEIDRKETDRETEAVHEENRRQIKSSAGYMRIAAVAAAFIVVFAGVNIVNESNKAKTARDNFTVDREKKTETDEVAEEAFEAAEEIDAETDNIEEVSPTEKIVKYEQLPFSDTDTVSFMASYVPQGDEYFVEKNVLAQTDYLADVKVLKADIGTDTAYYSLQIFTLHGRDGDAEVSDIYIKSSSPYILQENREYLIPLKYENGEYSMVFENAPQIEFTLDGGMVFQNGWSAICGNADTLEKDSLNVNDFYFDRMKYAPTSELHLLFDEWKQA